MKYSELRNTIKTGDILIWSSGGKWDSWRNIQLNLVKMMTMSTFNHIALAYVIGGRVFVIEAVVPYIRIFPLSRELPCYYIKTNFNFTEYNEEFMLSKIGLEYSKWEAIKALFTSNTNNPNKYQCAKLVNECLIPFSPGIERIYDTPQETVKYLNEVCGFDILYIEK